MRIWPPHEKHRIMALSWQPGFSLSRKPVRKRRAKQGASAPQFRFIVERPGRKQGLEQHSSLSSPSGDGIASSLSPVNQTSVCNDQDGARSLIDEAVSEPGRFASAQHWALDDAFLTGRGESPKPDSVAFGDEVSLPVPSSSNSEDRLHFATRKPLQESKAEYTSLGFQYARWSHFGENEPSPAAVTELVNASISPGLLYSSLLQRFSPVLQKCITYLCLYALIKI